MTALMDATVEQMDALGTLTRLLADVDRTIGSLQAARDAVLAAGSRWATVVAEQAGHEDYGDLAARTVAAEFAAAVRMSDRTMQRRMVEAEVLVSRFPAVLRAQSEGRISAAHARVIVDAGMHIDDETARDAYAEQVLAYAETESPNRVSRLARRIAERVQPRSLDERHRVARESRRVWVKDADDGMAELGLLGPAALVHGVFSRLTGMAERVQRGVSPDGPDPEGMTAVAVAKGPEAAAPDVRRVDEIRCDLALDLLLSGSPAGHDSIDGLLAGIVGQVSVTVPVLTLMGVDDMPAELDGRLPVDAATARRLAGAAAGWDRLLTHPVSGRLLAVDRYRPSAELTRFLKARDQRCRFPGCGRAAIDCDIDHTRDAALGGATTVENLGDVCRRHHVLKHHSPWHVEQLGGGVLAWTSPTGQVYVDTPPPQNTVTFTDPDEPPPF